MALTKLQDLRQVMERVLGWIDRHARLLVWIGLLVATLPILWTGRDLRQNDPMYVHHELYEVKEDIHNLYFAAAQARWRDIPGWWVGSWIYPNVGYYRPLTSVLFFCEYRLFDRDFGAYRCVTLVVHAINVGLLYLLAVSLFRAHPRARALLGLVAVYYFATDANTMHFGIDRVLEWWPAQNDALSLTFALLSLLLLDQYLHHPRARLLVGSLLAFYLSVASKEMGFMVGPMALALIWQRRGWRAVGVRAPSVAPIAAFVLLSAAFWFLRRILVPTHWGPAMFRWVIFKKGMLDAFGPLADNGATGTWWPVVAGAIITAVVAIGLRWRWRVTVIAGLCILAAGLCAQFVDSDGSWGLLLDGGGQYRLTSVLIYILAVALFWRYRRQEMGLFAGAALLLAYLPILQYGGRHYFYWPGAFNALADAVFVACLWRWARELRAGANWDLSRPKRWSLRTRAVEIAEAEAAGTGEAVGR